MGRGPGQGRGPLALGPAGCVRDGDRRGIPRCAASLLREPFLARCRQARPGRRQPRQGPDAEEGAWPANDRASRAPATSVPGRGPTTDEKATAEAEAIPAEAASPDDPASSTPGEDAAGGVVLDYCTAVRGILNDDQGGPLHPPGLRMAEALKEVQASLRRNADEKKGGSLKSNSAAWPDASGADWTKSRRSKRSSESMWE